ncbi:nitrate- and nitrite sensing domain-containing protein [Streptomyces pristinaespiralis]|uniref:nitrate- and nitrite sensing domain-containing protein n=1 Tax=Streptomyces pristinaespiralis TaxID=38300 RepID=UPI0037B5E63E
MSLRTALLVLAFVPGIALVALWGVTSGQTLFDFQRQAAQGLLAEKAGQPSNVVYYNLQEERRLSAEVLARRDGATADLARQRELTDEAVDRFRSLSDVTEDDAPREVLDAVAGARQAISQLPAQRALVDGGDRDQQEAVYDYYTNLIAVDLKLFTALSHVDNGRITTLSQPLVDLFWAKEMISRSDALLARGWERGRLSTREYQQFRQAVAGQSFVHATKVVPFLPDDEKAEWEAITGSAAWQAKTRVENAVLRPADPDPSGDIRIRAEERTWRDAMDTLTPRLKTLMEQRTAHVVEEGKGSVMSLLFRMVLTTVVGLLAVVAVIWTTWRLTRNLRRRISRLQEQAEALEKALPDVVERLGQGERIDVEAEARAIQQDDQDRASDELTRLGEALNLARTSALEAAVRQADQHRGFERLLQRIARRTQQLIGQQLKKLDELERRHEDPEVLDGLFDLDHLTARLRRYEENLVILAGGSPHRRWRKPVPLLDVMRSAQGEVQDYRRVMLDLDGSPWLSARAVGPVSHVLAELIENALAFSRPPSPVEVRAAAVSRGLAIEVEDRGLGMEEDQLADANELMRRPPRMDVLAHSDDIRLGLHVIARLASQYGLRVEFRSSAYGGTRAVVLVPHELTVAGPDPEAPAPSAVPVHAVAPLAGSAATVADTDALPTRVQGRALADVTTLNPAAAAPYESAAPPYAEEPGHPYGNDPEPNGAAGEPYGNGPGQYGESAGSYGDPGLPYAESGQPYDLTGTPHDLAGPPYVPAPAEPYGTPEPYVTSAEPYGTPGGPHVAGPALYATPGEPHATTPAPHAAQDEPYGTPVAPHTSAPAPYGAPAQPGAGQEVSHDGAGGPSGGVPGLPALPAPAAEPPLPRRVRQASLVDELRVAPADRPVAPKPPRWQDDPLLRPAPRRAGATIGAFQRRSRAARAGDAPTDPAGPPDRPDPTAPTRPTREERS